MRCPWEDTNHFSVSQNISCAVVTATPVDLEHRAGDAR